jgi:hypothetical protein
VISMAEGAWGTTSGFRSDYELTVTNSYWTPPTDKNPNWQMIWDGVDEDGEEVEAGFRAGAGAKWASFDGGETLDHEDGNATKNGKPRQFHQNSGVGKLITTFVEQVDEETLATLETPRDARVWIGSTWYMEEVDASFENRATKEKVNRTAVVPTKLIAFGGATPEGVVGNSGDNQGFDPQVVAKLRDIALASEDHAAFMNAALALPEVPADDKLVIEVSKEEFFQKLIDGE